MRPCKWKQIIIWIEVKNFTQHPYVDYVVMTFAISSSMETAQVWKE